VVAGASAGGYLCLCSAMIEKIDDIRDDLSISCIPNAIVVFNGGIDTDLLTQLFPALSDELTNASPINCVRKDLPPSIFFHGMDDANITHEAVKGFVTSMKLLGNETKLVSFEGMGHGFFNYGSHENQPFRKTLEETESFLNKYILLRTDTIV
jgi:acetyl esterase